VERILEQKILPQATCTACFRLADSVLTSVALMAASKWPHLFVLGLKTGVICALFAAGQASARASSANDCFLPELRLVKLLATMHAHAVVTLHILGSKMIK
jgi:hypothetical protein